MIEFKANRPNLPAFICMLTLASFWSVSALAQNPTTEKRPANEVSGSGAFVSYQDGRLTIRSKTGVLSYENVGKNYQAWQNNEEGPGSRLVDTVKAFSGEKLPGNIIPLTKVLPGTSVQVNVETKEIHFGFDFRVIGTFVSYEKGKLKLVAAEVPAGFVQYPAGQIELTIDPSLPVLESKDADYLKYAGTAGEVLKAAKQGSVITVRSPYDPDAFEVVEIGVPKHKMERYIGQNSGTARGALVSFKDGILRIQGKSLTPQLTSEYEVLVSRRITDDVPILESIDGGPYRPTTIMALQAAKEGTTITLRKVENVILDVRIGIAK